MSSSPEEDVRRLREELGTRLTSPARLKTPEGSPTGFQELDRFLPWGGFPKGALTALTGELGLGGTSLWVGAASHVLKQGKWAVWIDKGVVGDASGEPAQLFPLSLWQKELDLSRLVTIEAPESEKKLLWLLQELMASTLFEIIGCDLGTMKPRDHQLRKLQGLARSFHVSVVFFAGRERFRNASLFSLLVDFQPREISVERALHRPTPYRIPRRITYASFTQHSRTGGAPGGGFGPRIEPSGPPSGGNGNETGPLKQPLALGAGAFAGLEPRVVSDPSKQRRD